jgi:RNA polymerase sigma-70 factor, ECF subfamily
MAARTVSVSRSVVLGEVEALAASRDLVASAIRGDVAAFALLLDPLWDPAHRLAFSMLRDQQSAEDAVQEAALNAWRTVRRLRRDTSSLRPWFLTIVANQCRSMRRSPWSRVLRVTSLPDRASVDPEIADRIDTEKALLRLPGDQRLALILRYFLDLPMDEVATVLGVSVPAAKSRVRRALKSLEPALATMRERA